jgi:hypothetical protein
MAIPESLAYKLTHADMHHDLLKIAVKNYLSSSPVGLVEMPDSVPGQTHHRVQPVKKVPARIGLIFGDCLQNLRSTLDYLVYELVLANGGTPNRKHMFPIAITEDQYQRDIQTGKLRGVHPRAITYIEALQPFLLQTAKVSPLYYIDELTNLNKHRRPILAGVQGTKEDLLYNFPHIVGTINAADFPGGPITESTFRLWVGVGDEPALNVEVVLLVEVLTFYIRNEAIPLFEGFFG